MENKQSKYFNSNGSINFYRVLEDIQIQINGLYNKIDDVYEEELEAYENMPCGMQYGVGGENSMYAQERMEDALEWIEELNTKINECLDEENDNEQE